MFASFAWSPWLVDEITTFTLACVATGFTTNHALRGYGNTTTSCFSQAALRVRCAAAPCP